MCWQSTCRRSCAAFVLVGKKNKQKKQKQKTSGSFFVLRFYHHDKTDIIERLNHASGLKMALKMSSVVKNLMYVRNKIVSSIHSFRGSVIKKRFGSRIQSILLWT